MITRILLAVSFAACSVPDKRAIDDMADQADGGISQGTITDAGTHADGRLVVDASVPVIDAAPPLTIDAAPPPPPTIDPPPPPVQTCNGHGNCQLPSAQCLDANYLLLYTDARCVENQCELTREIRYCSAGCNDDGCR